MGKSRLMATEKRLYPWYEGCYKGTGCLFDNIRINGNVGSATGLEISFQHGHFGQTDEEVERITGKKEYDIKLSYQLGEKIGRILVPVSEYGVILDQGRKIVVKNFCAISVLELTTEEEDRSIEDSKDHSKALQHSYKVQPKRKGNILWITGAPGLGKSTTAQLIARKAGYVYYEGDCFFFVKNPFIPLDVDEPSKALVYQKVLKETDELTKRMDVIGKGNKAFWAKEKGKNYTKEAIEDMYSLLCEDIKSQQEFIGGDFVVAMSIEKQEWRHFIRNQFGSNFKMIILDMSIENQMMRIGQRHGGDEGAVELLKKIYEMCEPMGTSESNTVSIDVSPEMTPDDVVGLVMQSQKA